MNSVNSVTSSGLKTSDTQISPASGRVHHVILLGDGTNAASVVLYDTETGTATGTVLAKLTVPAGDTMAQVAFAEQGVEANRGIWADVSGTGAEFLVGFSRG